MQKYRILACLSHEEWNLSPSEHMSRVAVVHGICWRLLLLGVVMAICSVFGGHCQPNAFTATQSNYQLQNTKFWMADEDNRNNNSCLLKFSSCRTYVLLVFGGGGGGDRGCSVWFGLVRLG